MTVTVLKIRSCTVCGVVLSKKCDRCLAHPSRRPCVVTVYDLPPVLEVGPCGCIKIACERNGCSKTMWRTVAHAREFKQRYCSRSCRNIAVGLARRTRELVNCGNPKCDRGGGKPKRFEAHQYRLRGGRAVYCCPACSYVGQRLRRQAEAEYVPQYKVITADDLDRLPVKVLGPAYRSLRVGSL